MPRNPQQTIRDSLGADAWNKMVRSLRAKVPVQSDDHLVSHTVHGVIREVQRPRPQRAGGSNSGKWYLGEWNDTLSVSAQQVVSYTPDGGFEGTYICILDAPVGTLPSDGAPYYKLIVAPPAGVWAV